MSEKRPQQTNVLVKRLRRVAKWLDENPPVLQPTVHPAWKARANTCWQAAARLEKLSGEIAETVSE